MNRNMILAVVIVLAFFFPYKFFVLDPIARQQAVQQEVVQKQKEVAAVTPVLPREQAIASAGQRLPFEGPGVQGSILLDGSGRIDDLVLKRYDDSLGSDKPVVFLQPERTQGGTFGQFGWIDPQTGENLTPVWTAPEGAKLTPDNPVTLTAQQGGLTFTRTVALDEDYLFTISDQVRNDTGQEVTLKSYAAAVRRGLPPKMENMQTVHEGFTGVFDGRLRELDYKAADKGKGQRAEELTNLHDPPRVTGGWFGITDKYWLAAVVPPPDANVTAFFYAMPQPDGRTLYNAEYDRFFTLAPGETTTSQHYFFAGSKRAEILRGYQEELGIKDFDKAIDWGMFWFLTRPFFGIIEFFFGIVGNFGAALLLTTLVVKIALFPIAYNSYVTMSKISKLQPKMKEIQERHKGDPQKAQQETIRLYQAEKVNVATGCLPILLQIPVFYALYKVLLVTIEMRHAPFVGWIQDLSAPDPTAWVNLFGLLPFSPPMGIPILSQILAIGIWPALYGVTMWGVTAISPQQATDPIQRRIFQFMPVLFTFLFATFPAGMVIYWTWSNILTMLQQYVIMRRQGVETGFDKWVKRLRGGAPRPAE